MLQQTDQLILNHEPDDEISQENSINSEENQQKEKLNQNKISPIANGISNRKRRQIKMQRQEITSLFSDLVCLINNKVAQIQNQGDKSKTLPNPNIALKSKKSFKPRKEDPEKVIAPPRVLEQPTFIHKVSTKEDRMAQEKAEKERRKKQILSNYSIFMRYKIHDEKQQQQMNHLQILHIPDIRIMNRGIKSFSVFQQVSLTINPLSTNSNIH